MFRGLTGTLAETSRESVRASSALGRKTSTPRQERRNSDARSVRSQLSEQGETRSVRTQLGDRVPKLTAREFAFDIQGDVKSARSQLGDRLPKSTASEFAVDIQGRVVSKLARDSLVKEVAKKASGSPPWLLKPAEACFPLLSEKALVAHNLQHPADYLCRTALEEQNMRHRPDRPCPISNICNEFLYALKRQLCDWKTYGRNSLEVGTEEGLLFVNGYPVVRAKVEDDEFTLDWVDIEWMFWDELQESSELEAMIQDAKDKLERRRERLGTRARALTKNIHLLPEVLP